MPTLHNYQEAYDYFNAPGKTEREVIPYLITINGTRRWQNLHTQELIPALPKVPEHIKYPTRRSK